MSFGPVFFGMYTNLRIGISIETPTSLRMNIEQCLIFKKIARTNVQDIEWRENENMENADALGPQVLGPFCI